MRAGTFSSSSAYKLMGNGRGAGSVSTAFYTYVNEKRMELRLGRSLQSEFDSKETAWGNLNERRVFELLGLEYRFEADKRYYNGDYHSGMPDTRRDGVVGDIKCPFSLKSFCEAVDSFGSVDEFKAAKPEWYWQLVSNAILTGEPRAEIIVYCPYQDDLDDIRRESALRDGWAGRFNYMADEELPYIIRDRHYGDLNIFEFEVPVEDVEAFKARLALAVELLTKP